MEVNILLKERTRMINSKIKLHILGVPMNKLGNWLMWNYTLNYLHKYKSDAYQQY